VKSPSNLQSYISQHRFVLLFGTLLFFYVLAPIIHQVRAWLHPVVPPVVEGLLLLALLMGSVASVARSRAWVFWALLLGLPAVVLWLVGIVVVSEPVAVLRQLFLAAFFGYVIWVLLQAIFASRLVTFNTVCASLCVYLLLGLVWAFAYSVVDVLDPEGFTYTVPGKQPPVLRVGGGDKAILYFSFATLTTLGYGDIVPTSPISRMLASIEAITGQLYLAVLVARLVGMHIVHSLEQQPGQNEDGEAKAS
jgi:voltage-gated potassium channel